MSVGGRLQRYPVLRVVAFLVLGILVGDACRGRMGAATWQWMFVATWAGLVAMWVWTCGRKSASYVVAVSQTLVLFVLVAIGGAWRMACHERQVEVALTGDEETYEAVVASSPVETRRSVRCELLVVGGRVAGHKVNAYFQKPDTSCMPSCAKGATGLSIGDGVAIRSVLDAASNDVQPSSARFDRRHMRLVRGISARTFVRNGAWRRKVVDMRPLSAVERLRLRLQRLRGTLLSRLRGSGMSEDAYATIAAMTLGDKSSLSKELRESYSKAGASHVLALSGLHIGVIYSLLSLLFARRRMTAVGFVATTCLIWLFALMVGMMPSVVRSATMFTICAAVGFMSRGHVTLNSISVAAVVILLSNPASLWDIGFQMSFLAVVGISLGVGRMGKTRFYHVVCRRRLTHVAFSFVFVSVVAQVAVMPLVMYYFGRVSMYFLLANVIAIPLSTSIIYMSALLFLLLPFCPLHGCVEGLWEALAKALDAVATTLNGGLSYVASLPGASVDGVYVSMWQAMSMYMVMSAMLYLSYFLGDIYKSHYGVSPRKRDYSGMEIWD